LAHPADIRILIRNGQHFSPAESSRAGSKRRAHSSTLGGGPIRVVGSAHDGAEMTVDRNLTNELSAEEELVRRYFHEVLDQGKVELIDHLFHPQCVMHRPGGTIVGIDSVRGVAERTRATFAQFDTQIHDVFGSGDRLVARLSHSGIGGGLWRSRFGNYDVTGKAVTWDAIAIFRFAHHRIIEEWVTRDELGMILQFGLIETGSDKC